MLFRSGTFQSHPQWCSHLTFLWVTYDSDLSLSQWCSFTPLTKESLTFFCCCCKVISPFVVNIFCERYFSNCAFKILLRPPPFISLFSYRLVFTSLSPPAPPIFLHLSGVGGVCLGWVCGSQRATCCGLFCFSTVCSGYWTWAVGLGSRCLYLLNHLTSPGYCFLRQDLMI